MGLFGIQQNESSPRRNKDLQPDTELGHLKSSHPILNSLPRVKEKETLLDVHENIHEDSSSEELVSLDGSQKGKTKVKREQNRDDSDWGGMTGKTFREPSNKQGKV